MLIFKASGEFYNYLTENITEQDYINYKKEKNNYETRYDPRYETDDDNEKTRYEKVLCSES